MKKIKNKIEGGALPFAILVMVLIMTFCGLLVGIYFFYDQYYKKEVIRVKLNDNIYSASSLILTDDKLFENNDTINILLFNDSANMVNVIHKDWGGYEVYNIEARFNNLCEKKSILTGMAFNMSQMPTLYLPDKNNYLYTVGKMILKGNLYVPGGIIKQGLISGRGYDNDLDLEGHVFNSKPELPAIKINKFISQKKQIGNIDQNDSLLLNTPITDRKNSFKNKTITFLDNEDIILSNCNLSGNIIVQSTKKIEIRSEANLDGVIVSAPIVIVKENFTGSIQIMASDSIFIEKKCKLNYPSFICLSGDSCKQIAIDKESNIQGGIVLITKNPLGLISIEKDVIVTGIVYSQQSIDLKGKVLGSVFSNNITYNYRSSWYPNYFSDCEINSFEIPGFFVFPSILCDNNSKAIISWLN